MEFLLFVGMVILAVLVFDSRKTILSLRNRIIDLEQAQDLATDNENPAATAISDVPVTQPETKEQPVPAAEPALAKQAQPTQRLTAPLSRTAPSEPDDIPAYEQAEPEEAAVSAGRKIENLIGGKLPIWIGGIALVFAGFFLVRFSIESGLFGPRARCITASLFGLLLIGLAEFGNRVPRIGHIFTEDLRIGHSIAGAGIAVLYATLYMASELYGLLGLPAALAGVVAVTILAFHLSQKHGAPTAIMGLLGGFSAPYVAGLGPESIAPLLIYLGIFTAGLFGLAIHRGWAWFALLTTGGGVVWTSALLFIGPTGDLPGIGIFMTLLAIGGVLTLSRTDQQFGLPPALLKMIPLIVGLIQLFALAPLIEFSPMGWLFFAILALFTIALAWRDENMTPAVAGALGLSLAMVAVALIDHGTDHADLPPLVGFAIVFGLAGHIFCLRPKSGFLWALIGLTAPVAMLALAALFGTFGWSNMAWGIACMVVATTTAIMAWRTRLTGDDRIMPLASAITAIFTIAALWLWTPRILAAILTMTVAGGLAFWARHMANKMVSREAAATAIAGGLIAAYDSSDMISTLFESLTGGTDLHRFLPDVGPMVWELFLPSVALTALAYFLQSLSSRRQVSIVATFGLIGIGAFVYLLLKQILAIGPFQDFVRFGFAERALFTHFLALSGWLLLSRSWTAEWQVAARMLGWTLAGLALFRYVYFDILILSPTSLAQSLGPAPVANLGTLHYAAVALWLWLFAVIGRQSDIRPKRVRFLEIGSLLATIAAVMVTVRQAVHGSDISIGMSPTVPPHFVSNPLNLAYTTVETYLYSAGLLLLAIAWLVRGIQNSSALLRIAGLVLLTLVTFKVFLVDAAQLQGLLQILSFLGLGVALIGIGWLYGKFMRQENDDIAS